MAKYKNQPALLYEWILRRIRWQDVDASSSRIPVVPNRTLKKQIIIAALNQ